MPVPMTGSCGMSEGLVDLMVAKERNVGWEMEELYLVVGAVGFMKCYELEGIGGDDGRDVKRTKQW
jgi:hypothetical protein